MNRSHKFRIFGLALVVLLAIPGVSFSEEERLSDGRLPPEQREESIDSSLFSWPWASQNEVPPPEFEPYELPTFHDEGHDYKEPIPALQQAPYINGNAVFNAVTACYPAKDKWKIDVDLEGRVRSSGMTTFDQQDGALLGSNYIGLVARMPLYSMTELDRERTQDYRRRVATVKFVADFVAGIAERNHALRELALYSSLEARSRVRVDEGFAPVSEQAGYLDKVAKAQKSLIKSEAKVLEARLGLVAACAVDKADRLNDWLFQQAQIPVIPKRKRVKHAESGEGEPGGDPPDK